MTVRNSPVGVSPVSARLRAVQREHREALARVAGKQREIERFRRDIRDLAVPFAGRINALAHEGKRLERAIQQMVSEILANRTADTMSERRLAENLPAILTRIHAIYQSLHMQAAQALSERYQRPGLPAELGFQLSYSLDHDRGGPSGPSNPYDEIDDEILRRCQVLVQNTALLTQRLHTLGDDMRALRRSALGKLVIEFRRLGRARNPDPMAAMLDPWHQCVEQLRQLHGRVTSLRRGELSPSQFFDRLPGA